MEGGALYWVTWLRARKLLLTWEEFKEALVAGFDSLFKGNKFAGLSGVGMVEEHNTIYVQLVSQVSGLSDDHYLMYYMNRLKDPIWSSLRLLRQDNLDAAMVISLYFNTHLTFVGIGF
ncbi:unnamed protein product [Cuscuta epithymum]|uniref:Uncharacterized protein n=1 Tax=Cuscuta epithymum TaxID=186058 RepID=A0AAV0EEG9_9ASTE|nr:unnamed protein product [Cuscuta epithymum]